MGSAISKAAEGIGGILGNVFAAPFKAIFGESCEDVCSGAWDMICFIENLCVTNLVKLLMILGLCYILLMFFYLLFKVGVCQCIVRSLCKICWAGCETYWYALEDCTCFLWHKLKNTKRVHRRRCRFQDIEKGYTSSSDSGDVSVNYRDLSHGRKRKLRKEGHFSRYSGHRHHDVRLKTGKVLVHVKGGSKRLRSSRRPQLAHSRKPRKVPRILKRRRIR